MTPQVLIVGGGLAGLALARQLEAAGTTYRVIEARARLGGRIHGQVVASGDHSAAFDLGPAWFWPGQPRIAALVQTLGLERFDQYATGTLSYEDERGRVQRGQGYSMEGSYRLAGGLSRLVDAIAERLPAGCIAREHRAIGIERSGGQMRTRVESQGQTEATTSDAVVLALPPRVAATTIDFGDTVSDAALQAMRRIPTWMAGHAKVVAVYERPFWREAGLSGDAASRAGPLAEIHDASPAVGGPYALFGFVGVSVAARRDREGLLAAVRAQLVRLFGAPASEPLELLLQDWAVEPETAIDLDHAPLRHHPTYGLPAQLRQLCDGKLVLGSTEVAREFGGYLEGALEAAELVAKALAKR